MSTQYQPIAGIDLHDVEEEDHWISVSDLMAGLMMVFLFISVALMLHTKKAAVSYTDTQDKIYKALEKEFKDDLAHWGATINSDTLSFEFQSPDVLFDRGENVIKPAFKFILEDFFPRYLNVLDEYRNNIIEVRIEGHTSSKWNNRKSPTEAYFHNMKLSQERTRSVLEYVYQLKTITSDDQAWVNKYMAAVGLSSSHIKLGSDGKEDEVRSRRVTFRVITNAEEQLKKIAGKK